MEGIYIFGFIFFALAFGFFSGYLFHNLRQTNNDLSYNIVTIKEDLVNVQIKLEYITELLTVKND